MKAASTEIVGPSRERTPAESMQAYLHWEFGLVERLARHATHGSFVL